MSLTTRLDKIEAALRGRDGLELAGSAPLIDGRRSRGSNQLSRTHRLELGTNVRKASTLRIAVGQWYCGLRTCNQCCKGCGVKPGRGWTRFFASEGL
jgi:hypothetical protein